MNLTIPRDIGNLDPYYRYKRPIIVLSYSNKSGGQTKIVNIEEIIQCLVSPIKIKEIVLEKDYMQIHLKKIRKWFSQKMSTRVSRDFKLPGKYEVSIFEDILEEYIENYILCYICGNPETGTGVCLACGHIVIREE